MQDTAAWLYGGSNELFPNLTWETRPNMAGSEASESLQRAWVTTIMAIQDVLGAVKDGNCHLVNLTAGPLVEHVLDEPVKPCAGYAAFVEQTGRIEYGLRHRPAKWASGLMPTQAHMCARCRTFIAGLKPALTLSIARRATRWASPTYGHL